MRFLKSTVGSHRKTVHRSHSRKHPDTRQPPGFLTSIYGHFNDAGIILQGKQRYLMIGMLMADPDDELCFSDKKPLSNSESSEQLHLERDYIYIYACV